MKGQTKAAIVTQGPSQEEILKNINPADFMNTMAWMSNDWLEMDKLFIELGYPTQYPTSGQLYPMADRFRDFCLNAGLDLKAIQILARAIAKDEEE